MELGRLSTCQEKHAGWCFGNSFKLGSTSSYRSSTQTISLPISSIFSESWILSFLLAVSRLLSFKMPVTESNFPLQPSSSHSNFLGPRRRALTIPLPRSPFQPPDSLLEDLSTTRKHLVKSPSRMKTLFKFRKRSLSLVYPLIQATHDQSQSHICTLPREIRDQIWKLLIDESPFAIHILYPWEMKHSQLRSCAALHEINPAKALNLKPLEMSNLRNKALLQGLLNLTRTCRVVYVRLRLSNWGCYDWSLNQILRSHRAVVWEIAYRILQLKSIQWNHFQITKSSSRSSQYSWKYWLLLQLGKNVSVSKPTSFP